MLALWPGGSVQVTLPARGALVVGRSNGCDVVIDHPSVAQRHLVIRNGNPVTVEALGLDASTRIGGRALIPGERTPLRPGLVLEVGPCTLFVETQGEPPASRTELPTQRLDRLIERAALTDSPVLLVGEEGSGRQTSARTIHAASRRASGPLHFVACARPGEEVHRELLGESTARPGLFALAKGGTLVLLDLASLPAGSQATVLAALQRHERLGGGAVAARRRAPVRLIGTADKSLDALVAEGAFDKELYSRFASARIDVPPLRQRLPEVLALARLMLAERAPHVSLTNGAEQALLAHDWPGNLTELRNAIARAAVLASTRGAGLIAADDLRLGDDGWPRSAKGHLAPLRLRSELMETARDTVLEALRRCGGNQTRAAALLGISRRGLVYRIETLGLPRPRRPV